MRKDVKGKIRFTWPRGSGNPDYVSIEVEDAVSGVHLIEIRVQYADFAQALSSMNQDCTYDLNDDCPIGMQREVKTELVPRPKFKEGNAAKLTAHLAPFEVDGWVARTSDLFNWHCNDGGKQRVTFIRFVEPSARDAAEAEEIGGGG